MEELGERFNPQHYWEQRLLAHPDITGVGYLGLSPKLVEYQYRIRMYQVELILRHYGLTDLAGRSILDIGSGTGIWLKYWHQHGASHVVGLDFTQTSVNKLRTQFPNDLIVQADVSVAPLPLPDTMHFDIISAFDVLLHIVDPDNFRRALANLASYCTPGGWVIITDPIQQGLGYVPVRKYGVHSEVWRSFAEYRDVLAEHGFVIESIRPAQILLNGPIEAPNHLAFKALTANWRATMLWGRSNILAHLLGPIAFRVDQLACHLCSDGNSPTSKILVARKHAK
jgi:2-polyprenyl-3-methyl-5-hydroxy-6-metoxy-1,4-benzoquinol methylase